MQSLKFKWETKYETGIASVDQQHKYLFEITKNLSNAYLMRSDKKVISKFLFELEDYTKYHFKEEEDLFLTRQKPINNEHLDQHRQFEQTLHDLKFDYVSDNKIITEELLNYLIDWLIDHILKIDKADLDFISTN